MPYTEIKKRNENTYYYRVISVRFNKKVAKKRIYLGKNLNSEELFKKETNADKNLLKEKINKNISKIRTKMLKVLKKYKIKKASIFGSYVRGEQKKDSDIDILVKPAKKMGLEFVGMALELEDKLGKKVDLVTYKSIHPLLKKKILSEEVRIIWKEI